jgi:D-alanyl-D-alanine endopeptidase (penicillin-binding protein 7)
MTLSARRAWGHLALLALLAIPAMTAEASAAPTPTSRATSVQRTTPAKRTVRAKRRRARRPPPGGVYARHAVVLDPVTNQVLFAKNSESTVPIASLTKLMTALVFLDLEPDLSRPVEVTMAEIRGGGRTRLYRSEQVELGDLLRMSLMCSDNVATRVLMRESGLAADEFVTRMNRMGLELGLEHARFVEPTGLDERNVATASDVAKLLRAAARHDLIREISTTRSYEFRSRYKTRGRLHTVANTNRLLYGRYEILGGKTGFISEAGYCLATWVRTGGRDMIAVVLGAPTNATRFADVVRLVQKTMSASLAP